jgi:modulator of FtsH protease HflC
MLKQSKLSIVTGIVLLLIFGFLLFTYQVRQTEVAVVTTFGRFTASHTKPGFKGRLPWPIQKVYKFENRLQTYEKKFEQTTTKEGRPLLVTVYVGWRIGDAKTFLERFDSGDVLKAEASLENLVRNAKNAVIGQHSFSELISTRPEEVKFDAIEAEMLAAIKDKASSEYGIEISLLGLKQLGLPEGITGKVFERMQEERQRLVKKFNAEGDKEAETIRAEANRKREEILAQADARATEIRGQADAEAAKHLAVFEQNPELAVFIFQLKALEASLRERSTLILDQNTPPFNMLQNQSGELPKKK